MRDGIKSGMWPVCECEGCVLGEIEWMLVMKYKHVQLREIPDFWETRWVTNPSGTDIKIENAFMNDDKTEEEWEIFRVLFKKIAEEMEKDGWCM